MLYWACLVLHCFVCVVNAFPCVGAFAMVLRWFVLCCLGLSCLVIVSYGILMFMVLCFGCVVLSGVVLYSLACFWYDVVML